jgi:hypothetical protein
VLSLNQIKNVLLNEILILWKKNKNSPIFNKYIYLIIIFYN